MTRYVPVLILAVAAVAVRLLRRRHASGPERRPRGERPRPSDRFTSAVALVAAREVRERLRGRAFRVGTLLILVVVAAAIAIPAIHRGGAQPERVGVVGALPAPLRAAVASSASSVGTTVRLVSEADEASARAGLEAGRLDLAVLDGRALVVRKPIGLADTSMTARFVLAVSRQLGVLEAVDAAHLSAAQAAALARAKPLPIRHIDAGTGGGAAHSTSLIGIVLVFVMLTQYNTWTLIGVMEEKSSRVIEVLLAAVRPIQLLTGKVLGIGLVALGQATLIVAFALSLAKGVGSDLLQGTAPLVLAGTLVWLLLGYAFYSWVYAAAGSLVERQDQVQSMALPLSLPIIFGYIVALTAAGSGSPSLLVKILAYLPPTAPFEMPVLVGMGAATWWQFLASVLVSIGCTVAMARFATGVYRRAILRTGGRVSVRGLFAFSRTGT